MDVKIGRLENIYPPQNELVKCLKTGNAVSWLVRSQGQCLLILTNGSRGTAGRPLTGGLTVRSPLEPSFCCCVLAQDTLPPI